MNDLRCTIYDIRCAFLKCSILLFLFICYPYSKAQNISKYAIDSTDIARRTAFQDSIFKGLIKAQSYKPIITKNALNPQTDSFKIISVDSNDTTEPSETIVTVKKIKKEGYNDSVYNKVDSSLTITTNTKIKKQKKIDTTHYSPKKAAIWGAAFPGLGQIYNKRYWKLPIVYGVLATALYFVVSNGLKLKQFNGYISNIYDSVPNPAPYDQLDLSQIESYRNSYRRNVQLASFGTIFAWGLSIVDAVVDAHLRHFDISDKLTLKVKPQVNYSNFTYYAGIGVNLNFK